MKLLFSCSVVRRFSFFAALLERCSCFVKCATCLRNRLLHALRSTLNVKGDLFVQFTTGNDLDRVKRCRDQTSFKQTHVINDLAFECIEVIHVYNLSWSSETL